MPNAAIAAWILGPLLSIYTLLFLFRIILTWYPEADLNKFPFAIVAWPTEPFLIPVRKLVPPIGGRRYFTGYLGWPCQLSKRDSSRSARAVENDGLELSA